MGWELRSGKRVYYRKVREGGRVRPIYCGGEKREAVKATMFRQSRVIEMPAVMRMGA